MGLGEYSGTCVRRTQAHGLLFTENKFPPGRFITEHSHAYPHVTVMLAGSLTETYADNVLQCAKGAVLVVPANQAHTDRVGDEGAHTMSVELSASLCKRIGREFDLLSRPRTVALPSLAPLFQALYIEFKKGSDASPLALESLCLHFILSLCRQASADRTQKQPTWLPQVLEAMSKSASFQELAQVANVHPSHLSRVLSRHLGCSATEYMKRLRLEKAAEMIVTTSSGISAIAAETGFYDQAHLCRSFKGTYGQSPSEYRKSIIQMQNIMLVQG
jgi:AraC family transcriptional regulator